MANIFFCEVIFKLNTSRIKNQRLICKLADLGQDAHPIFNDQLLFFLRNFFETVLIKYLANTTPNAASITILLMYSFTLKLIHV